MFGNNNSGKDLTFHLVDDKSFVFQESGNQTKVFRYGYWSESDSEVEKTPMWECRTVFIGKDGSEKVGKGCAFSQEGADELARIMVEQGLGHTADLLAAMKDRKDFKHSLKKVLGNEADEDIGEVDTEYYDANSILNDIGA